MAAVVLSSTGNIVAGTAMPIAQCAGAGGNALAVVNGVVQGVGAAVGVGGCWYCLVEGVVGGDLG